MVSFLEKASAVICATFICLISTNAISGTVNFAEPSVLGFHTTASLDLSNATIAPDVDPLQQNPQGFTLFAPADGINNTGAICAGGPISCDGHLTLSFDQPVKNVSVGFLGYDSGDNVIVSAFYQNVLQNFVFVSSQSGINFGLNTMIDELYFRNNTQGDGRGLIYNNITFDEVAPVISSVPLPAALPLFAGAVALFGFFGYRRKRNS
jgi:hypothetical protein